MLMDVCKAEAQMRFMRTLKLIPKVNKDNQKKQQQQG